MNKRLDGKRWGKAVRDLLWLEKQTELLYLNWLLVVDDTQVLILLLFFFGKDNFSSRSPEEEKKNKQTNKVIIKDKETKNQRKPKFCPKVTETLPRKVPAFCSNLFIVCCPPAQDKMVCAAVSEFPWSSRRIDLL